MMAESEVLLSLWNETTVLPIRVYMEYIIYIYIHVDCNSRLDEYKKGHTSYLGSSPIVPHKVVLQRDLIAKG